MTNPAWNCQDCPLARTRQYVVWGEGPDTSDLLLIGEAPGYNEDQTGRPFVGKAGKLLDQALAEVGLDRATLYITNSVKCRPPDNRKPMPREEEACEQWLEYEVQSRRPRVVVLLGRTAIRRVLPSYDKVPAGHARSLRLFDVPVVAIAAYHPSYAARQLGEGNPRGYKALVRDLRRAKRYLALLPQS